MATYTRLQCKEQTLGMISLFLDHPALFTSITKAILLFFLKSFYTNLLYEENDFTLVLMLKNVKKFFCLFLIKTTISYIIDVVQEKYSETVVRGREGLKNILYQSSYNNILQKF